MSLFHVDFLFFYDEFWTSVPNKQIFNFAPDRKFRERSKLSPGSEPLPNDRSAFRKAGFSQEFCLQTNDCHANVHALPQGNVGGVTLP